MTVGELIRHLEEYLHEDKKGRYYHRLRAHSSSYYDDVDEDTIDCVYFRCGEVVLQSNETDNGNWSLIIPYIIHCLKFFDWDTTVVFCDSDEDLDYEYYDITDFYVLDEEEGTENTRAFLQCCTRNEYY